MVVEPGLKLFFMCTIAGWDFEKLQLLVSNVQMERIVSSQVRCVRDLICIWKHSTNRTFSSKSAWQLIRNRGIVCSWKKWLWQQYFPKKMYFLCW